MTLIESSATNKWSGYYPAHTMTRQRPKTTSSVSLDFSKEAYQLHIRTWIRNKSIPPISPAGLLTSSKQNSSGRSPTDLPDTIALPWPTLNLALMTRSQASLVIILLLACKVKSKELGRWCDEQNLMLHSWDVISPRVLHFSKRNSPVEMICRFKNNCEELFMLTEVLLILKGGIETCWQSCHQKVTESKIKGMSVCVGGGGFLHKWNIRGISRETQRVLIRLMNYFVRMCS